MAGRRPQWATIGLRRFSVMVSRHCGREDAIRNRFCRICRGPGHDDTDPIRSVPAPGCMRRAARGCFRRSSAVAM